MKKLLGDTGYEWDPKDGQQAVSHLNTSENRSNANLSLVSDVVFRFRLLDIYSDVLGVSRKAKRIAIPRMDQPDGATRRLEKVRSYFLSSPHSFTFNKLYKSLQDWHQLIFDFNELYSRRLMGEILLDQPSDEHVATNPEQQQFLSGLACLSSLGHIEDGMKYSKIMANIVTLASCVWWFNSVCIVMSNPSLFSHTLVGFCGPTVGRDYILTMHFKVGVTYLCRL